MNIEGKIIKALSGFYEVFDGAETVTCRARGRFRHQNITPLVGDSVLFSRLEEGSGRLEEILPRKNAFQRPAVANIDLLIIVASGAIPLTDPFLIDRMTATAESKGCESLICLNKWDLSQPEDLNRIYTQSGFPTVRVSAETGEGIEALAAALSGKIAVFTGNSGVGKSSILNALDPSYHLQVGEVSDKLGRGRHTTRHVEFFTLKNGGIVGDTPGFSSFDVDEMELIPKEQLQYNFREFAPYLEDCRFTGCSHTKEKGCAVLAALEAGKICPSRHASYIRLWETAGTRKNWESK